MQAGQVSHAFTALWQRWSAWILFILLVAFSIPYGFKAMKNGSAIVRWQSALLEMANGKDIFNDYVHPNSPMMALLLLPFSYLPPLVAGLAWFYIKVLLTFVALYWVFRLVESPGLPWPPWARALTILLSLRPILGDLQHGNINLWILFLVVGALYAFHRGRDLTAGVVLGLAIVCKVTPALFVPYFLWKRAWKTLAGCVAGLVLFVAIVPSCAWGPATNTQFWQSWVTKMIAPFVIKGDVFYSEHNNQSLPGLLLRLASHSPSFTEYVNNECVPTNYHNLTNLDPRIVGWAVKGCMAGFALLVVWSCRTPTTPRSGWRLAAEFSLVVLGMLLFSERTWKHHCATLVLPFAVLTYYLAVGRPSPRLRCYLLGTLALAMLLMSSTSTGILDNEVAKLAEVYGAYVWTYLILGAAMVVLLRRRSGFPA